MEIKFDINNIRVVKIDEVRPNDYNPKDKRTEDFEKIKKGIELKGQRLPIIVRDTEDIKVPYEIIDGEQRWTACKELGSKEIIVYSEGKISDKDAKELTIWYQQQVPFNEIELASLVAEVVTKFPDFELPFTNVEIEKFKELAGFNWEQYETNKENDDNYEEGVKTLSIKMSDGQYQIVMNAIAKVKADADCPDGRALELICIEFLNSPVGTIGLNQV